MSDKFNPRDIPNRAHYDRLMTWATSVLGKPDNDLGEFQQFLSEEAAEKVKHGTDDEKLIYVLAELGFCAVIDNMADIIESRPNP